MDGGSVAFPHRAPITRSGLAYLLAIALLGAPAAAAQDCSARPLGLLPIDDLHEGAYRKVEGGLYPGRSNQTPAEHLAAGKAIAKRIVPLDAAGNPAADGRIVCAGIGPSLAGQVFEGLRHVLEDDPDLAAELRLPGVIGNSVTLERMRNPDDTYWKIDVPGDLAAAGLTAAQVQVVWIMNAFAFSDDDLPFPLHVPVGADAWTDVMRLLLRAFPNLKLAFLSPLYSQAYSDAAPVDEPYYFEQGFAVRELIARQLAGAPELNYDPALGKVEAPWIDWGPYFWSDAEEPRTDGLSIVCADISQDGQHLEPSGKRKLGERLAQFLKSHRACTRWSVVKGTTPSERRADVERIGDGTRGSRGEPRLCGGSLPTLPHEEVYRLLARGAVRRGSGLVLLGDSLDPGGGVPFAGGLIYVEIDTLLPISFDDSGNGRLDLEPIPDDPALIGRSWFAQLVAYDRRGPDGVHALSAAIEIALGDGAL
ncbi:MAG: hypothetical protein FJ293_06580 [Planctomycetes bacterium]|nr:hypothetical protein [Planctomycetota bacterium]